MTTHSLFPTLVYSKRLQPSWQSLNSKLLRECKQLEVDDEAGRRWSRKNYPAGYTSYSSASRMHQLSPTFAVLERVLNRHVATFARALEFDLEGRELSMTDCWVNIMPTQGLHSLHLHPLSTISGTYYVQTPAGRPGLKFEDPRLDRFMAAPPRRTSSRERPWKIMPASAGTVIMFESWLRHEVTSNTATKPRISISFNYGWF
jgi:uncharacterized protein (TIGR02466 family)